MSSFDYLTTQVRAMYVYEIIDLKPQIRQFRLRAKDGLTLPSFTAGAHIRIQVMLANGALDWRHYSLIHLLPEALPLMARKGVYCRCLFCRTYICTKVFVLPNGNKSGVSGTIVRKIHWFC